MWLFQVFALNWTLTITICEVYDSQEITILILHRLQDYVGSAATNFFNFVVYL